MKTRVCIAVMFLLATVMFISCDRRSLEVPTDPTAVSTSTADWVLALEFDQTQNGSDFYHIRLYNASEQTRISENSDVTIILDTVEIALQYFDVPLYGTFWYAEQSYPLNNSVSTELWIDGSRIMKTTVTPVNKVSVAFPGNYDYQEDLNLNWAVASGNQYQFVRLDAWFNNTNGDIAPYDFYIKQVAPYARNHIIPANSISLIGDPEGTSLVLSVREVNYKIINKTAVMVFQDESQGYSATGEELRKNQMRQHTVNDNQFIRILK
jgi:hypothetical protein